MQVELIWKLEGEREQAWNSFLASARHQHPRQSPRYGLVERAVGHDVAYIIGHNDTHISAVAMASLLNPWPSKAGYSDAAILSGPVCDDIEAFKEFLQKLVQLPYLKKVGRLRISPYWLDEDAQQLRLALDQLGWRSAEEKDFRHTGLIDLQYSDEELLQRFSKSARREVRRAQRQGITVREMRGNKDGVIFYASLNRLRAQRGLTRISTADAQAQFEHIYADPALGVALGAYHQDRFVSGLLLYHSKQTAHGRYFTTEPDSLRALSNLRIAPLIWWSGMVWARNQGCRWLDMEGYRADVSATDPKYNIYKYKGEYRPTPTIRVSEHYFVTNVALHAPDFAHRTAKRTIKNILRRMGITKSKIRS